MALINCPECSKEISDKVKTCPHCGFPLVEELKEEELPQKVELTDVKLKGIDEKLKKKIITACIAVALIIVIIFGISVAIKSTKSAKFSENLSSITTLMLEGAVASEDTGNLIKSVWYNSIYEERDSETDKYTRPDGYFVEDFNTALGNLFDDSEFQSDIDNIKTNQDSVKALMKEMTDVPEEYADADEVLKDMYESYLALTGLAVNPTGSLQDYGTNFNDADSEFAKYYEQMGMYTE